MTKILVAVEDASLFGLLEYKLSKEGYQVTGAPDGEAVQARLAEAAYDVLLLDLMIPKIDGFQILRGLLENPAQKPNATLIISARSEEEDVLRAFELGALDYITKPFSLNVLIARIEIALQSKALQEVKPEALQVATQATAEMPFSLNTLVARLGAARGPDSSPA